MTKVRSSILFTFIALISVVGTGQSITREMHTVSFDSEMLYMRDSEKHTLESAIIALHEGLFIPNPSDGPLNFGYDSSNFWFYVDFEVAEAMKRIIEFDYPYHQYIDLYINQDSTWQHISSGNLRAYGTRGVFRSENFAWPLELDSASHVKMMINVKSKAPVIMSFEVKTMEKFVTSSNLKNLLYGIFFGILLIMVVYNLFIYVIIRDRAYLYYVLLVMTNFAVFASVTGYAFHYLYPNYPDLNLFIREFLIAFLTVPTSLFAMAFLDVKRYSRSFHYVLIGMIIIGIIVSVLTAFNIVYGYSSKLISIHAPLLLLIGIVVRIKGNKNASFYILAWTGYLIGGLAMTLRNAGVLPANFITDHGAEMGTVLEVFLLALALANRYRQIRNERSRLQRINLELVEKQNVLLENKVKERTKILDSTLEIVQRQYSTLIQQSVEINSSIDYALNIQEAIFPERTKMNSKFREVILFHQPKQTVSGDFAFYEHRDDLTFVAAVDCTGHGVPGALMSMVGYNLFYDAVNVEKIERPSDILTYVEHHLNLRLHQDDRIVRDGMEVALCVIDRANGKVRFCGAQRPLLVVSPDEQIKIIGGTKKAIGGHFQSTDTEFHEHEFDLIDNTTLYLYSDGFQDQFGGEYDKKFLSKRLNSLLCSMSSKSGDEQEKALRHEFEQWRGAGEQVDDVLVMGVKI